MFRRNGYVVREMWECRFRELQAGDPAMRRFFEHHHTERIPPLRLRDALYGGRTSALRSYVKCDLTKGEVIKFVDVTSQYPNANLRFPYPAGHPDIFLKNDPKMPPVDQWNGVVKAKVLPPADLFLPVLPYRTCSKLMFPLCRTCAESQNQSGCDHFDPEDRALTGTWPAPEIKLAVEKRYKVMEVYEVYQYPEVIQFDPKTREDGLFSGYVREMMALKQHASGWPAGLETEDQKVQYTMDVLEKDGILLECDKMERNEGLRTLAKLILNSFWGKMGEKTLRALTKFVTTFSAWMALINDPKIEIRGILPIGEECLQVSYVPKEDSEDSLVTSSLVHAAFTTCYGRLHLYKYLDMVGGRALYHDTDSVCYLAKPGLPDPPIGRHLGDLTDQIQDDYGAGSFCFEFVSGGAKNYSYKIAVGGSLDNVKVVTKVRGISINSSNDDLLTFENLRDMVLSDHPIKRDIPLPSQIARLRGWRIVTRDTTKAWRVCLNKRRRVDKERTVPYGYVDTEDVADDDEEVLAALAQLADA
ncbi:hypothetical protein ONE63_011531 [Megalurothrips usitatus]|uniref:DNA-directed DNA polymerase n=1 Tax=Megalurothrips usitatus TaxID=439358 RepID=A0AAV7X1L5_9NEOP|nr:hypothetical protein ONE63_011531 [Megalurothrips usitatus]